MLSSMLVNPLPPFLDTYSLSLSSLGCKAFCIVISFLVLRSICFSYLVSFEDGPKYPRKGDSHVFIPFIMFLLYSLVSSSFPILLRYSFFIFLFHLRLFDGVRFQYYQIFIRFLFFERPDFSWFGCSISSVMSHFPLFVISMVHFFIIIIGIVTV